MPRLQRATFIDGVHDVWRLAQQNFAKDGAVHGHLLAMNEKCEQLSFMQADPEGPMVRRSGMVGIPGPWQEHEETIGAHFKRHRAVAVILIGEAWSVSQEAALDSLTVGERPSEHPMRDEIVFVVGAWPREFAQVVHTAVIEREKAGPGARLVESEQVPAGAVAFSWLMDLLPGPHDRP